MPNRLPEKDRPPLRVRITAFALLSELHTKYGRMLKSAREELTEELVDQWRETDATSREIKLGGKKIGTASLSMPKDKAEVAPKGATAFTAWVAEHYPTETETIMEVRVRESFAKAFLSAGRLEQQTDDDGNPVVDSNGRPVIVDTKLGVVVPGVRIVPAADPKSFSIRLTPEGKSTAAQVADGWDYSPLLAIEGGEVLDGEVVVDDSEGDAPGDVVDAEVVDDEREQDAA